MKRSYQAVFVATVMSALLATGCASQPTQVPCDSVPVFLPSDLAVDRNGNLWIVGNGGVVRRDPTNNMCTVYTEENGLADNYVRSVTVAPDDVLWFGTDEKGVSRFDGKRWTTYGSDDGLAGDTVFSTAVAPDGALWFGTNFGVSRFDGRTWTTYTADDGLPSRGILSLAAAPDGTLWFGTWEFGPYEGGVARFDGETWTSYTTTDGLAENDIKAIVVAGDGLPWVGTFQGVARFDGERWVTYTEYNGLADNNVNDIAIAPEGVLWFGTTEGIKGVAKNQTSQTAFAVQGIFTNHFSRPGNRSIWVSKACISFAVNLTPVS